MRVGASEFVDSFGTLHCVDDPDPCTITIGAIARGLSRICRFGGHCTRFYSVASHSVHVSRLLDNDPRLALWGLLHDAAEAYIGDLIRPVKMRMAVERTLAGSTWTVHPFRQLESRWLCAIGVALDFPLYDPEPLAVRIADRISLATEFRDNMPRARDGSPYVADDVHPDVRRLHVPRWAPAWRSERAFLSRYRELRAAV